MPPWSQLLDRQVTPLLAEAAFTEDAGRELAGAAAELAQLAGWMAFDGEQHGLAQRYLTQALGLARLAADDALGAEILAAMSQQAVYVARPDQAIDLARVAQASARTAGSAVLLAECHVAEAHGHAARNDARACAAALGCGRPGASGRPGRVRGRRGWPISMRRTWRRGWPSASGTWARASTRPGSPAGHWR